MRPSSFSFIRVWILFNATLSVCDCLRILSRQSLPARFGCDLADRRFCIRKLSLLHASREPKLHDEGNDPNRADGDYASNLSDEITDPTTSTSKFEGRGSLSSERTVDSDIDVSVGEYIFGKPGEFTSDLRALGTSPRRFFFQVGVVAPLIALSGNLFGVTGWLLSFAPDSVLERSRLDTFYPTRGFRRWISEDAAAAFLVPAGWVEDQAIVLARTRERAVSLTEVQWSQTKKPKVGPEAGFGPAGRSGDNTENVSIVRSKIPSGFSLQSSLGSPEEAAKRLLEGAIAPPGSGRTTELLRAEESMRGDSKDALVYEFEYRLTRPDKKVLRNIAVISARGTELFTLTVLAPDDEWRGEKQTTLERVASSFHLLE